MSCNELHLSFLHETEERDVSRVAWWTLEEAWNEESPRGSVLVGLSHCLGYLWWPSHQSSSVMDGEHAGDWEPSQTTPVGCVGTLHDHCRAGAPVSPLLLGTPSSLRVLLSHQCHSVWMKLILLCLPLLSWLLLLSLKSTDSLDLLPIPPTYLEICPSFLSFFPIASGPVQDF